MAACHIAGLIAYLICLQGNVTPAAMSTKLKTLSLKGVLTGIRQLISLYYVPFIFNKDYFSASGTLNDLAHNAPILMPTII